MLNVRLERLRAHETFGLLGVLLVSEKKPYLTLELPWNENKPNESCIPPGSYRVLPIEHGVHGRIWKVLDVPGREGILFHPGNYRKDTHGCILVGERLGKDGILDSKLAFESLRQSLPWGKLFKLTIAGYGRGYSTVKNGGTPQTIGDGPETNTTSEGES